MKFFQVKFKIASGSDFKCAQWSWTDGYAVDCPEMNVRFAVSNQKYRLWIAIHWDTGHALGRYYSSREECADKTVELLKQNIKSGELDRALARIKRVINIPSGDAA